jgi:hypothetical protein
LSFFAKDGNSSSEEDTPEHIERERERERERKREGEREREG